MKRMRRILMVAGLAVALFVAGGIGVWRGVRQDAPATPAHPVAKPIVPAALSAPLVQGSTLSQVITQLQARLRSVPNDWSSYAELGLAYVQQARVSADPSYYPKAQAVLQRSLAMNGTTNFDAMTGQAALAAARHDFAGALSWGEKAAAINPYDANVYAVIGDAQVELGRYPQAFATFQKAVDLKPNLATYARASYAWELQGNVPYAIRAMNLALQAAGTPSDAAWAMNQLGDLYWNSGNLARAQSYYRQSASQDPTFIPPQAGLAKVEAARGDAAGAIAAYRSVVPVHPLPPSSPHPRPVTVG